MELAFTPFASSHGACSSAKPPVPGSIRFIFWEPASRAKNQQTTPIRRPVFACWAFPFGELILRVNTNQAEPQTGVDTNYTDFHEFRVGLCNSFRILDLSATSFEFRGL